MDIDLALHTLELFARGESVNVDQTRQAARLVSHYVDFLELYASPEAVSASRNGVRLVAEHRSQPGDFLAIVTLGETDYVVSSYGHILGGTALRFAGQELARKLDLRIVEKQPGAATLPPFSTVISAANKQPQRKTNQPQ